MVRSPPCSLNLGAEMALRPPRQTAGFSWRPRGSARFGAADHRVHSGAPHADLRLARCWVEARVDLGAGATKHRLGLGGFDVDVIGVAARGGTVWHLTGLLGRSMGNIRESASNQFTIYPEGHAFEAMGDIQRGLYASLDAALAEIRLPTL